MFLVDSVDASTDWDGINGFIKGILEKAEAEIVSIRKWDERKLAYEIKGKARGTYILCYFRAEGGKIGDIERDVQLSERIMRVLILSTEGMSKEDIEKETPASLAEKRLPAPAPVEEKVEEVVPAAALEEIAPEEIDVVEVEDLEEKEKEEEEKG
jgi:small subunit ribosomal protein S6